MKSLKVQFVLLFLSLTCSSFGQSDTTYDQLVEATNRYLVQYEEVQVFGGYYSIKDLGLTEVEKNQLIEESDYDDSLTPEKDSIRAFPLIEFLQERIVDGLQKITEHEDFQGREIQDLI